MAPRTRYTTPQNGMVEFYPQVTDEQLNDFLRANSIEDKEILRDLGVTRVAVRGEKGCNPLIVPDHVYIWVKA